MFDSTVEPFETEKYVQVLITTKLKESNSSSTKTSSGAVDHQEVTTKTSNMAAVNKKIAGNPDVCPNWQLMRIFQ